MHLLENHLKNASINSQTINDLSSRLVLKEIYRDEVTTLQDKLDTMHRAYRARIQAKGAKGTPEPTESTIISNREDSRSNSTASDEIDTALQIKGKFIKKICDII